MEEEVMTDCNDVTIYLVKKAVPEEEEATRETKRRKQEQGASVGAIHLNSRKLHQCSKYFETCMSERWANSSHTSTSSSRFEFSLVVQTETAYYEDCFARMSVPFPKPIPSITHCIELLKVASQIQCQDVVDVGMKYLATVPWSEDDETQIRDFCNSGHFPGNSADDLKARLDFPSTKEEIQKKFLDVTKKTLRRHLEFALSKDSTCYTAKEVLDSRELFEDAFDVILSDLESDIGHNLLGYVMTLLQEGANRTLISVSGHVDPLHTGTLDMEVLIFCWAHELSRRGNASQRIVELILKHQEVVSIVLREHGSADIAQCSWAVMMRCIFRDLLDGNLVLKNSERFALLSQWNWILKGEDEEAELFTNIVLTFPLAEQQRIYDGAKEFDGSVLSRSHAIWLNHLLEEAVKGGPKFRPSEEEEDPSAG